MLDLEDLLGHYAEELQRDRSAGTSAERVLALAATGADNSPDDRPPPRAVPTPTSPRSEPRSRGPDPRRAPAPGAARWFARTTALTAAGDGVMILGRQLAGLDGEEASRYAGAIWSMDLAAASHDCARRLGVRARQGPCLESGRDPPARPQTSPASAPGPGRSASSSTRPSSASPWSAVRRRPAVLLDALARVDHVEAVAADLELVAVGERRPLDPLAVDEEAVEAAVVECAQRRPRRCAPPRRGGATRSGRRG